MFSENEHHQEITRTEQRKRAWNDLKFRIWSTQNTLKDPYYRGLKVRFVKSTLPDIVTDTKEIIWPRRRK